MTQTTTGLDPGAIQSVSPTAIAAAQESGQQRLELIARTLSETGLRPLARGLLRTVVRHQDKPRMVRLGEKMVEVNPAGADAEMDVTIEVAIGRDQTAEKIQMLLQTAAKIEQVIAQLGPMNPVAGVVQWRNAIADVAELSGFKNSERFFKAITPEVEAQLAQAAGGQNKPSPDLMMAQAQMALSQAEVAKIQAGIAMEERKQALAEQKAAWENDRLRDQDARAFELRRAEIASRWHAQVNEAAVEAEVSRDRMLTEQVSQFAQHVTPPAQAPGQAPGPPGAPPAPPEPPADIEHPEPPDMMPELRVHP